MCSPGEKEYLLLYITEGVVEEYRYHSGVLPYHYPGV